MAKSKKLPAMQFYPGDWRKDPGIQSLSYEERGIWFEILLLMWESESRGMLILNGKPIQQDRLALLLGLDKQKCNQTVTTFVDLGVASVCKKTGVLFNRRMVRDEKLTQIRREAGKKGGNPNLVKQNPTTVVKQNPTPSLSSSSSTTKIKEIKDKTLVPQAERYTESISRIFAHWQTVMNHPRAHLDDKRRKIIRNALKTGYAEPDLIQAIDGCAKTAHNMGKNDAGTPYDGLHIIFKDADNIDRFKKNNLINPQVSKNENSQRDSRSRAKKFADKLDEIARKDIEQNGYTDFVG